MAFAHDFLRYGRYRRVFDVRIARPIKLQPAKPNHDERMAACEFGSTGRDPRYPSGWFILPAFLIGVALIAFLL